MGNEPSEFSWGMRYGNYVPIREIIIDNLEKAIRGEMTAEEALNRAAYEGNLILEAFENDHA